MYYTSSLDCLAKGCEFCVSCVSNGLSILCNSVSVSGVTGTCELFFFTVSKDAIGIESLLVAIATYERNYG